MKFPLHVQHQQKIIISLSWSSLRNLTTACSLRNTYYTAYFVIQSLGVEWSQHPVRNQKNLFMLQDLASE